MAKQTHGAPALIPFFIPELGQIIKSHISKGIQICIVRGILCFFFLLFSFSGIAQQSKIDSLEKILKTAKEDTNKVKTFDLLAQELENRKPTDAIIYANQGLALASKLNFKKGISSCLNLLGNANQILGEYEKALKFYEDCYKTAFEIKDSMKIAVAYDNIGSIYLRKGETEKCIEYRRKGIDIYRALNKEISIAGGLVWIGNAYKQTGEYSKALDNYFASLKIFEKNNSTTEAAYSLINISSIFRYMKQYSEARQYASNAYEIFLKANLPDEMGTSLYRIALIFNEENQVDSSTKYLLEAKKIFEKLNDINSIAIIDNGLGNNFQKNGNFEMALKYFNDALNIVQKTGDRNVKAIALGNIGIAYQSEEKYSKALEYFKNAEKILQELKDKSSLKDLSVHFIQIYVTLKSDSALKYFQIYQQLSDTLFDQQSNKSIAEMKTKYETEKKDKEIALLNSANKIKEQETTTQRNYKYAAIAFVILLLATGVISFNYIRIRNKSAQLTQRHEIRQKLSKDLHDDLKSGLTAIAIICENRRINSKDNIERTFYEKIRLQAILIYQNIDELIWANNPETDDLQSLCANIRVFGTKFFEHSTIRYEHKLPDNVSEIKIKPDVKRNLFLVVKEALHNCIKHSEADSVEVIFQLDNNKGYILEIADNGKGIDANAGNSHRNGMKNMRDRIEIIEGKFEIVSGQGEGTRIRASGSLT